jgi:hypothetical protein
MAGDPIHTRGVLVVYLTTKNVPTPSLQLSGCNALPVLGSRQKTSGVHAEWCKDAALQ